MPIHHYVYLMIILLQDALKKENAILDLQLEAAKLQLALIKRQIEDTA